jgi:hypothetical protein
MDHTELSDAERVLCSRYAVSESEEQNSTQFLLAPGQYREMRSYWIGKQALLHVLYTLHNTANALDIMDIAAVRNVSGQDHACKPAADALTVRLGDVRVGFGLGAQVVSRLELVNTQTEHLVHGELGQLVTFFAEASDATVVNIRLVGLLAAYVRGNELSDMQQKHYDDAIHTVQGKVDFSPGFRQWCNSVPDSCVYEYFARHRLYNTTKEVNCASDTTRHTAQKWIQTSFGAVHDAGHIQMICRNIQGHWTKNLKAGAFLVHTMQFLDRSGAGWNSYSDSSASPTETFLWPLFEFDTTHG